MKRFGLLLAGMACTLSLVGCSTTRDTTMEVVERKAAPQVTEVGPEGLQRICDGCGVRLPKDEIDVIFNEEDCSFYGYCKDCLLEQYK